MGFEIHFFPAIGLAMINAREAKTLQRATFEKIDHSICISKEVLFGLSYIYTGC